MKLFKDKKIIKIAKGFTIIETLVAVSILMISIVGPLTISHKGLLAALYARDNIIGSYLAQDLLEYVKNVRDNNKLQGRGWLNIIDVCTGATARDVCNADTLGGDSFGNIEDPGYGMEISTCDKSDRISCSLSHGSTGYYPDNTNQSPTQFKRYFYIIKNPSNDDEATLYVTVEWQNGTINNNITYKTEIFDVAL